MENHERQQSASYITTQEMLDGSRTKKMGVFAQVKSVTGLEPTKELMQKCSTVERNTQRACSELTDLWA